MDLGLSGKVAVVAASSRGLGFYTVKNLLAEGTSVLMNGRTQTDLEMAVRELGDPRDLKTFEGDVTQKEVCEKLIENAVDTFGSLDVLVTNCGGPDSGSFEDVSINQWQQAIDLSFLSHIYLIQAALPHLKKSSSPSILTVTSFTVKRPMENLILSNSVRAATIGLTKSLSKELGPSSIRVNSILPGWTRTDRVDHLINERVKANNSSIDQEIDKITRSIPLKRMADPDEFGKAAAFLVSPAASYITGVMLTVDGGITDGLF
jgi:3-oxoacyl-[acyl-carrier protein] reductase